MGEASGYNHCHVEERFCLEWLLDEDGNKITEAVKDDEKGEWIRIGKVVGEKGMSQAIAIRCVKE